MSARSETEVCVVFTVRERYAHAPKALKALYAGTRVPFRLLIVDAATPKRYLPRIEAALRGRERVDSIVHDGYLLPNKARNLAIASVKEPFVLFLENDCEIRQGCLERLLAVSKRTSGVAVPWIWEEGLRHFDDKLGRVRELENGDIAIDSGPDMAAPPLALERVEFFEHHCFLLPRKSLEATGPFDAGLNVAEIIDFSLALRRGGVPAFLVPGAEVDFFPPPPINGDELAHFRARWDARLADASIETVRRRWRISNMRQSSKFARDQRLRVSRLTWYVFTLRAQLGRMRRRLLQAARNAWGGQ